MEWDQKYKLGIIWQDFQHEQLFKHIDNLTKAKETGMEKAKFYKTISFIERYTQEHFDLEAKYMEQHRYPKILEHQKEHAKFIEDFRQFKSSCIYEDDKSSKELLLQLSKWVVKHIMKIDKDLAEFLQNRQ
ncbi:MAG: hemerythrin family protein [Desulfobacteraceae bacterium]|nr:hemerythrin family protein [Desulfobacteraceae bacterium]